jgi:hypothetical protein
MGQVRWASLRSANGFAQLILRVLDWVDWFLTGAESVHGGRFY